ncbi:neuroligin-4, X-linked-like, partial [Stegodyphus dumicola]|uniref:neuroligin-4, X-linked-like n=1 Tax=Stegodyphus dumicola TaxID=202533 RepID=UPI0015B2FC76
MRRSAMKASCIFVLILIYLSTLNSKAALAEDDDYPIINTKNGRVKGKILKLTNGREVAAFLGIFFAEPPVGHLRFKAPVPKAPWKGIFNATTFGPLCAQSKNRSHWDIVTTAKGKKVLRRLGLWNYSQGEDCLNLNIYVPAEALPSRSKTNKPLSVMFFIHGGSYKTNGGRFYPGEWLASAGQVIVVTVNYRLGVLGFLSTEDSNAKGNYGLLDQILALKWVKENIAAFGGNSTDVTIFGNSAGGACVGLHLVSPVSRGKIFLVIELIMSFWSRNGSDLGVAVRLKDQCQYQKITDFFDSFYRINTVILSMDRLEFGVAFLFLPHLPFRSGENDPISLCFLKIRETLDFPTSVAETLIHILYSEHSLLF